MFTTREAWLLEAVEKFRPLFLPFSKQIPDRVQVSTGWAKKSGKGIGFCYPAATTGDVATPIFISPSLAADKPVDILGTLLHECVHAADNCESKHRGWFAATATALGLEGKMTATTVGPALGVVLEAYAADLGEYPHAALDLSSPLIKRDKNRQIKIECASDGYKLRGSRKVLELGIPDCPVCGGPLDMEDA